jgi:hypothetical protein
MVDEMELNQEKKEEIVVYQEKIEVEVIEVEVELLLMKSYDEVEINI